MKITILKVVLAAAIVVLAYLVYDSIMQPIEFLKEKRHREVEIIQKLKDIRDLQTYYKNAKGSYTANFDSLIAFASYGEIPVVRIIPDPNDTTFTLTISDTLGYIKVFDSLFGKRKHFDIKQLAVVPFTDGAKFEMDAGEIERGGVKVSVFEAKVHSSVYLKGLDQQRVLNQIAADKALDRYPGLKVGSLTEPTVNGNWE
ncbi:MAG TPA: hypothetical protein PKE03_00760 [Bacteroidales bacterium]|nr:hypothetical protein [Bacteroidales bacterium]